MTAKNTILFQLLLEKRSELTISIKEKNREPGIIVSISPNDDNQLSMYIKKDIITDDEIISAIINLMLHKLAGK